MNGPFVISVTRFRVRGIRFLPLFLIHAHRTLSQIRRADGYLGGALRQDRDRAYWTMSAWRDEAALLAYVTSGAHRDAMPKLSKWGDEGSTVRWLQDDADLPDWLSAIARMRKDGRAVPLRYQSPSHADIGLLDEQPTHVSRI